MAKIFLSYSRKSQAIAKNLVADIEALGYSLWFDQELSGGQVWWNQILENIRNCDVFVFVLDPESINSVACKSEFDYAAELGKPILPILVSDGVSTNLLPSSLTQIQFVDYRKQDRSSGLCLARALSHVPPPKSLPDPLPSSPEAPVSYLKSLFERVEAKSLTYEQQCALYVELKRSLRESSTIDDVSALLKKLRKRRDLFATIAEEIDELLINTRQAALRETEPHVTQNIEVPAIAQLDQPVLRPALQEQSTPATVDQAIEKFIEIRSPIDGTFFRSPSFDSRPFINVGDKIKEGDVLCIIEAMRLMHEIESEVSGTIVEVLVDNGKPVEYNQALFRVKP
ncbi:MAG: acetyl-CoA carboxylase biotin carboxyl carrier protein [Chlorobaculum sp.]|nr:acetyl-CoA carboxylase biotin carboxyl carrier protein [Chlorobaculum sp.]